MAFYEAYFDESGSHYGAPSLCVAAYVFERDQCKLLDLEWKAALEEYSLPFFHMVDCAHGAWPFSALTLEERIAVEKRMIAIIRNHMLFGAAITVNEAEYNTWSARRFIGSAYVYCCWQTLAGIQSWMTKNNIEGEVAYFFEAGHENGAEANILMKQIFNNPDLKKQYRYGSHSFVDKKKVRPVQTADILAWLHANHFKRLERGERKPRADYVALVEESPHEMFIANTQTVAKVIAYGDLLEGREPQLPGITGSWGQWRFWFPY